MKRRTFFQLSSLSLAGMGLAGSCTRQDPKKTEAAAASTGIPAGPPAYRNSLKTSNPGTKKRSAGDTVVLALIGAGAYGTNLILQAAGSDSNIRIKYVCDVDDTRGGHAIAELKKQQGTEPLRVRDMRKVFDDSEVDGVFIATPEHWHSLATIWACQAGKDVYVEKTVSHDIYEGQKMIEAAMKYGRVVQCGMQNRSADYALSARDYIKSGELGDIVAVHIRELDEGPVPFHAEKDSSAPDTIDWDRWLGPAPKVPYNVSRNKAWGYYWDYSGGYAMSGGIIHQLDLARLVLGDPGFPSSVYCTGGRYCYDDHREVPDYQMATFDYGNFILTLEAGEFTPYMAKSAPAIRFGNDFPEWKQNSTSIQILGTRRMMYVGRMGGGWQVYDKDGRIVARQPGLFPLQAHIKNYVDCIRTRKQPNGAIVQGHNSGVLIHLANIAYRVGKKQLDFSPESETITNNAEALQMAYPSYRRGYEIPKEV